MEDFLEDINADELEIGFWEEVDRAMTDFQIWQDEHTTLETQEDERDAQAEEVELRGSRWTF